MIDIKTLDSLLPGERGTIVKVGGDHSLRHHVLSMGITAGTEVEVERVAPFGDPMEIKILGYHLSLRREEAKVISVEVNMVKKGAIPLMKAKSGEMLELVFMDGGEEFQARLAKMELAVGARFKLLHAGGNGPVTILVGGKEHLLGWGMVKKIFVKKADLNTPASKDL